MKLWNFFLSSFVCFCFVLFFSYSREGKQQCSYIQRFLNSHLRRPKHLGLIDSTCTSTVNMLKKGVWIYVTTDKQYSISQWLSTRGLIFHARDQLTLRARERSGAGDASNMSADTASAHKNQYGGRFAQISMLRISTVYFSRITSQV